MRSVDLSSYNNDWYNPGGGTVRRLLWYFVNLLFFVNPLNPLSGLKVRLLRAFGAHVGRGVVIKPGVNIKYPWRLHVGDHVWIGENVWIDNLADVRLGDHVCLSQGAMLLCGSHDYKRTSFDLRIAPITLAEGCWIGARATVCPGATGGSHSVLAVASVATGDLAPYTIYQGNPAQPKRRREIAAERPNPQTAPA
ncbi:MAG: WcaF family extracellular polysaccharide biosynthesis acetyltransferase [Catalinimonas sp.]